MQLRIGLAYAMSNGGDEWKGKEKIGDVLRPCWSFSEALFDDGPRRGWYRGFLRSIFCKQHFGQIIDGGRFTWGKNAIVRDSKHCRASGSNWLYVNNIPNPQISFVARKNDNQEKHEHNKSTPKCTFNSFDHPVFFDLKNSIQDRATNDTSLGRLHSRSQHVRKLVELWMG